jgi:hypothetical protein
MRTKVAGLVNLSHYLHLLHLLLVAGLVDTYRVYPERPNPHV